MSRTSRLAVGAVALAALLAAGTTGLIANATEQASPAVREQSLVNYDGTRAVP